jgi:prephenate dehydrogenase
VNVFTNYFRDKGHSLNIYDLDYAKSEETAKKIGVPWFDSARGAVSNADLVVLCTPTRKTSEIIPKVIPHMKKGSILCEIASLKTRVAVALDSNKIRGIQPLSIHPMFGPDINRIEGQTIIMVPIHDREKEMNLTEELFPQTEIIIVDAETHDFFMATILSLPYFMNLVFAKTITVENMELLRKFAGTTFTVQLALAQSIVGESSSLIESLINENMFSLACINRFIDESMHFRTILGKGPEKMKEFCDGLNTVMLQDPGAVNSRRIRNEFLQKLIRTDL